RDLIRRGRGGAIDARAVARLEHRLADPRAGFGDEDLLDLLGALLENLAGLADDARALGVGKRRPRGLCFLRRRDRGLRVFARGVRDVRPDLLGRGVVYGKLGVAGRGDPLSVDEKIPLAHRVLLSTRLTGTSDSAVHPPASRAVANARRRRGSPFVRSDCAGVGWKYRSRFRQ